MHFKTSILLLLMAGTALAVEPVLTVEPRELRGVPGEPLRVELTIITPDAQPVRVFIPSVSNLVVRAVEKIPIRRTANGLFIQKRIIIWQGIDSGTVTLTNLTAVLQETKQTFPSLKVTIDDVKPASPPAKEPAQ